MKPCPIHLLCGGGSLANPIDNTDTPFANLSSEAPDVENFFGFNWGLPGLIPPIGTDWDIPRTPAWCVSQVSDIDAQLCADNKQTPGTINGGTNGDKGNGWGPPGGNHTPYFFNQSQSCSFICPDGSPFTFTVAAGTFSALNLDAANSMAYSWACRFAYNNRVCFGTFARYGCVGTAYNSSMSIDNANGPYTVTLTGGSLPPGLTPSSAPSAMFLKGTPTAPGDYTFTLNAVDRNGNTSSKTFTISIIGMTNITPLPTAMEGRPYSYQLQATGGTGPYTYVITEGGFSNLALSSSGLITGTPDYMSAGTFPLKIKVTDSGGNSCVQNTNFTIVPAPGPNWDAFTWSFAGQRFGTFLGVGRSCTAQVSGQDGSHPGGFVNNGGATGVTYTGPAVNARLRVIVSFAGTPGVGYSYCSQLKKAGVFKTGYGAALLNGIHDFDFNTGVGAGEAWTVDDAFPGNDFIATFDGVTDAASITWQIFNL